MLALEQGKVIFVIPTVIKGKFAMVLKWGLHNH